MNTWVGLVCVVFTSNKMNTISFSLEAFILSWIQDIEIKWGRMDRVKWPHLHPSTLKWPGQLGTGDKTSSRVQPKYAQFRKLLWTLCCWQLGKKKNFALFHFSHHLYRRKDKVNQKKSVKCQPLVYPPHQRLSGGKRESSPLIMKPLNADLCEKPVNRPGCYQPCFPENKRCFSDSVKK